MLPIQADQSSLSEFCKYRLKFFDATKAAQEFGPMN